MPVALQFKSLASSSFCLIPAWFHLAIPLIYHVLRLLHMVLYLHSRISILIHWVFLQSSVFRNTTHALLNRNCCIHWNSHFIIIAIVATIAFKWIIHSATVVAVVIVLARIATIIVIAVIIILIHIITIATIAVVSVIVAIFTSEKSIIITITTVLLTMCN